MFKGRRKMFAQDVKRTVNHNNTAKEVRDLYLKWVVLPTAERIELKLAELVDPFRLSLAAICPFQVIVRCLQEQVECVEELVAVGYWFSIPDDHASIYWLIPNQMLHEIAAPIEALLVSSFHEHLSYKPVNKSNSKNRSKSKSKT